MTKAELISLLEDFDDDEVIDLSQLAQVEEEYEQAVIEELEERQSQCGFYAFRDAMDSWRFER